MATTQFETGTLVAARPWKAGQQLAPRRGIVLDAWGDMWLVWFPSLEQTQAMTGKELTRSEKTIYDLSETTLRRYARSRRPLENQRGGSTVFLMISRAYSKIRAAKRA